MPATLLKMESFTGTFKDFPKIESYIFYLFEIYEQLFSVNTSFL